MRQAILNILLAESALLLFLELDLMLVAGGLIFASAVGVASINIHYGYLSCKYCNSYFLFRYCITFASIFKTSRRRGREFK